MHRWIVERMNKHLNDHHALMDSRHGKSLFGRFQTWDRATSLSSLCAGVVQASAYLVVDKEFQDYQPQPEKAN